MLAQPCAGSTAFGKAVIEVIDLEIRIEGSTDSLEKAILEPTPPRR